MRITINRNHDCSRKGNSHAKGMLAGSIPAINGVVPLKGRGLKAQASKSESWQGSIMVRRKMERGKVKPGSPNARNTLERVRFASVFTLSFLGFLFGCPMIVSEAV